MPRKNPSPEREPISPDANDARALRVEREGKLRALVEKGQETLFSTLNTIGVKPGKYPPHLLAEMIGFDPNMLQKLPIKKLPDDDRENLLSRLGAFVGTVVAPLKEKEMGWTRTMLDPLTRHTTLVAACREKILTDPGNFASWKNLENLQKFALCNAIQDDPVAGAELADACPASVQRTLVRDAVDLALLTSNDAQKAAIAKAFLWVRLKPDPSTLTIREHQDRLEEVEEAALRSDKNSDADADDDDEESSMEDDAVHPLLTLFKYYFSREKPDPIDDGSMNLLIAIVRFIDRHPETVSVTEGPKVKAYHNDFDDEGSAGCRALLPAVVAAILATVERFPRSEIHPEVFEFLVHHLSDPAVSSWSSLATAWPMLDPKNRREGITTEEILKKILYTEDELADIEKTLGDKDSQALSWFKQYVRDPLLIKTLSHWIQENRATTVGDQKALRDAFDECVEAYRKRLEELGDPKASTVNPPADTLKAMLWFLAQKHMPITEATMALEGLSTTKDYMQRSDAMDAGTETLIARREGRSGIGWDLWSALKRQGMPIDTFRRYLPLMKQTFGTNPARATALIQEGIIEPLLRKIHESARDGVFHVRYILEALNLIACFDVAEATSLLDNLLKDKGFRQLLGTSIENWGSTGADSFRLLAQLCYADITYPHLTPTTYADRLEGRGKKIPPALAWALDQESKSGVHSAARGIPVIGGEEAFANTWNDMMALGSAPVLAPLPPLDAKDGAKKGPQSMREIRDEILSDMDGGAESDTMGSDYARLPEAPDLKKEPKEIASLSAPLQGDAQYLAVSISDDFDPKWLAHTPQGKDANMAARPLLNVTRNKGKSVTLTLRMNPKDTVPVSMGSEIVSAETESGRFRWAGHWSRRLDHETQTGATITYRTGENQEPGDQTLDELLTALPPALRKNLGALSKKSDLPRPFQAFLASIDVKKTPLRDVVRQIADFVRTRYEYCFLTQNPSYREQYEELLKNMPYDSARNEYLAFIHSLRTPNEETLGRGMCGQLATVLESALRSVGVPAYFASGFLPDGTTITTNDAHAWVNVPLLNKDGELFFKPIEATSGGSATLHAIRKERLKDLGDIAPAPRLRRSTSRKTMEDTTYADISALHRQVASVLGSSLAVTRDDIWIADTLIQAAASPHAPTERAELMARLQHPNATLPAGAVDRWNTRGTLFSPRIRKRLQELSADVTGMITPAAAAIVDHLMENARKEYEAWQSRTDQPPALEDWLEPSEAPKRAKKKRP